MFRLALAGLLLLFSAPASAVFIANEMDVLDTEPLFDTEYFQHLRMFSDPLDWEWASQASTGGYRINAASLNRSDLLLDQRLAFARRLNDWLGFRYGLRQRGDEDLVELHQWLSLEAGPWAGLSFGIFGEPQFAKEDADIGALCRWEPGPGVSMHASVNAVDFNFNERNRTDRSYARKPATWETGLSLRLADGVMKAVAEIDLPLLRAAPEESRLFGYRRTRSGLRFDRPASEGRLGLMAEYSYEFKRKSDAFAPDPARRSESFLRRVHQAALAGEALLGAKDRLEAGGLLMFRSIGVDFASAPGSARRDRRWEAQPYARWGRELKPWVASQLAAFMSFGESRHRYPDSPASSYGQSIIEASLVGGFDFVFGRAGRIGLYGTADLDDIRRHAWDGGNVRAMFFF
ncbi:MAG: hypothetical protein HY922_08900 [Elusimicrobia bacterium]|nr:hypothetical protein [Elusimicrobiota bacterium]